MTTFPPAVDHDGADEFWQPCPCGSRWRATYREERGTGARWYCGPCWATRYEAREDAAEEMSDE